MTVYQHPFTGLITISHEGNKEKYLFHSTEEAVELFKSKYGIKNKCLIMYY